MESLKKFRVDFRITFDCEGRKGIFFKKPYRFPVSFQDDFMRSTFFINTKTEEGAIKTGEKYALEIAEDQLKQAEERQATGDFIIFTGNMADGKFRWSPKIYRVIGYRIKFISCEMVCDWSKERVERAAKELTMEQFKQVFNEIPTEIFK